MPEVAVVVGLEAAVVVAAAASEADAPAIVWLPVERLASIA